VASATAAGTASPLSISATTARSPSAVSKPAHPVAQQRVVVGDQHGDRRRVEAHGRGGTMGGGGALGVVGSHDER
jgi:hypothetical protein